jgi:hypothetical protein
VERFFKKHSQLASLFRLPGGEGDPDYMASLAGLQTRAQVNGIIQAQLSNGGAAARDQLRQNLQAAQAQMNQLKDKILKFGSGSLMQLCPKVLNPTIRKQKLLAAIRIWSKYSIAEGNQLFSGNK